MICGDRVTNRIQLSSDGLCTHLDTVECAFGVGDQATLAHANIALATASSRSASWKFPGLRSP